MTGPIPNDRVDGAVAWLRTHQGSFTDEVLRQQLLTAGYTPGDVDIAFARLRSVDPDPAFAAPTADDTPAPAWRFDAGAHAGPPAPPRSKRDMAVGFVGALGLIVGVPVLLVSLGASNVAGVFGVLAFLAGFVAFISWNQGDRRGLAGGIGAALLAVVLAPVVAVVGLFGYCLVQGAGA